MRAQLTDLLLPGSFTYFLDVFKSRHLVMDEASNCGTKF